MSDVCVPGMFTKNRFSTKVLSASVWLFGCTFADLLCETNSETVIAYMCSSVETFLLRSLKMNGGSGGHKRKNFD